MAHTNSSHRRTHNILLISKLLNQREGASPFTLVLDNLEQPAKPLLKEFIRRANSSKSHVVFLAFETARTPPGIDTFVPCWNKNVQQIVQAVRSAITSAVKRCLIVIDGLNALCKMSAQPRSTLDLTSFLMSLLQPPQQTPQNSPSLVAVYHQDMPLHTSANPYSPGPLSLLEYSATTIMTVHSLSILLAEKQAKEKSLGAPSFGLAEQKEGLVVGLKPQARSIPGDQRGIVIQLEHRRRSGRGLLEWYFLPQRLPSKPYSASSKEPVLLLDDHPLFRKPELVPETTDQDLAGVTFELNLTTRQRMERDGVVLPYFDAQKAGGGGEGGRILYDMGAEDDFDEEEDEI
ncbi:hypothetical protein LTS08_007551 [Lithohypha guttulata]|nr:hypothetical protein LTS08_007551 [Lithohypha guttulata]